MKIMKIGFCALMALITLSSCSKDDDDGGGVEVTPPRDRGEVQVESDAQITEYLKTHTYNYEEFSNPSADFDYKIRFDSIAGEFADKTPLMDSVKVATVRLDSLDYKLYTLVVREGAGKQASYADSVFVNYEGKAIYEESIFDKSANPVWLGPGYYSASAGNILGGSIPGFASAMNNFKGSSSITQNADGTLNFGNDYGIGAVFIPSGLGYFNNAQSNIPAYSNLIFKIYTYDVNLKTDADNDNVPNSVEDLNHDQNFYNEDTDGNGLPNYVDSDDDGDRVLTRLETEIGENGTVIYLDTDNDGTPDYLDDDDDGDGELTINEISVNSSGVVFYRDSDGDGTPDYLDPDS